LIVGRYELKVSKRKPQTRAQRDPHDLARLLLEPHIKGAVTVRAYSKAHGELDLTGLSHAWISQTQAVVDANLTRAEAILMIQAHALEALYHQLAQRAIKAECLHYLPGITPYGCHRGT
jgi:hypothetical protein